MRRQEVSADTDSAKRLSPTPVDHVVSVRHGSELILLDTYHDHYFALNETGAVIWTLLCDGRHPDDIAREISDDFDVSLDVAARDVELLLKRLALSKLISAGAAR